MKKQKSFKYNGRLSTHLFDNHVREAILSDFISFHLAAKQCVLVCVCVLLCKFVLFGLTLDFGWFFRTIFAVFFFLLLSQNSSNGIHMLLNVTYFFFQEFDSFSVF